MVQGASEIGTEWEMSQRPVCIILKSCLIIKKQKQRVRKLERLAAGLAMLYIERRVCQHGATSSHLWGSSAECKLVLIVCCWKQDFFDIVTSCILSPKM